MNVIHTTIRLLLTSASKAFYDITTTRLLPCAKQPRCRLLRIWLLMFFVGCDIAFEVEKYIGSRCYIKLYGISHRRAFDRANSGQWIVLFEVAANLLG